MAAGRRHARARNRCAGRLGFTERKKGQRLGICIVTVTYADRGAMVREQLGRIFGGGQADAAIVVDNGSTSDLAAMLAPWADRVTVIANPANLGTAVAFGQGIAAACAAGWDHLLLMDDDNAPRLGCIERLRAALDWLTADHGEEGAAVLAFRPDHHKAVAIGRSNPLRSSFLGFDIRQIVAKIGFVRGRAPVRALQDIDLPFASYGGLMAHRRLFERIGLPHAPLLLYADDTDYSWRITAAGGVIRLVVDAEVDDLGLSWTEEGPATSMMTTLLTKGSDFRLFYSTRNRVWFDRHRFRASALMYAVNRCVFLALLRINAARLGAGGRLALLRDAVRDGEAGRLGADPRFPLP